MTALTASRRTDRRIHRKVNFPVKAATKIYSGALVAIDASGWLVPASEDATLKIIGKSAGYADNTDGSNGDLSVDVESTDIYHWKNSAGGDEITKAHVGRVCYAVDDQTVALTGNAGTRPVAGEIVEVDASGVWVDHSGLAGERRSSTAVIWLEADTLVGSNTYYAPSPYAGDIVKIYSTIDGALATGDATLTAKIGATPITGGAITITQSGSAAGDVDSATPTAANTVAAGDAIAVTVGGANTNAVKAQIAVEIRLA